MFYVTKTYGHELGLSACFRQWKAKSHCRFLHGYPLSFKLQFGCNDDELLNDWVLDFGGLKEVKAWLVDNFDHRMLIADDDPMKDELAALAGLGLANPIIIPGVGCESFAKIVYDRVTDWLGDTRQAPRVFLHSVEVREHGGNSAIYKNENAL